YKGTAPAMNDLLGGQVDFMCDQTTNTTGQIQGGKVKAFGVTSKRRVPSLPNIPTLDEQGIKGFEVVVWHGLYVPKGTPKPVVDRLNAALRDAIGDADFKANLARLGAEPVSADRARPEALHKLLQSEIAKWGPNDPRLGKIDAVLLSHVHGDHIGPAHQPSANAGACGNPEFSVNVAPNSNTVDIAVGKKAKLMVGAELGSFFAAKMKTAGGNPAQVQLVRFGAMARIGGVKVATVPAVHTNGLPPEFLDKNLGDALRSNGLTAYVGPPNGYILAFTNGLVVYLSGDTGITAEQELVVRRYYKANLAVINIGDVFSTGPTEAAYVIDELVKPNAAIAS